MTEISRAKQNLHEGTALYDTITRDVLLWSRRWCTL